MFTLIQINPLQRISYSASHLNEVKLQWLKTLSRLAFGVPHSCRNHYMAFKKSLCQMHQGFLSGIFLTLMLLTPSAKVLAEGGHGGAEFQGSGDASQMTKPIPINASIAEQMGIKVEPVTLQKLAIGIRATGQIET